MAQSSLSAKVEQKRNDATAGPQHIASQLYDEDAYKLWNNLRQCKEFNECRKEIFACIKAPADVFTYFYELRTNAQAKEFTDALHMSIQFVPPERVWQAIVQIRRYRKYSSIRNLVLTEMSQLGSRTSQQAFIKRQSDTSQRSQTHLSAFSSKSGRTSGISTNTSFTLIEEVGEPELAHSSSLSEKVLPELPLAPGRGYRKAPIGQCFLCPIKECKGMRAYRRVGDYLNHMHKEHPSFPPHDPSYYLRKDLRVSTTLIEVKGDNMEDTSATTAPESPGDSYPDVHALSDASTHRSEQDIVVVDFENFPAGMPMDFGDITLASELPGNTGSRPLFGEVAGISQFHLTAAQQQQSYFYHGDEMQTG